jgi:catechol 2,3-dioxygenase-like lactoylglutathione lyase family enzyme
MSGVGPLKRLTLWVRDAEASLALYRDLLGLEVIEDKLLEGVAVAALLGLEAGRLRIVHLASGGRQDGWIGLYELSAARPAPPELAPPDPRRFAYGQAVAVFETNDIEALLARLQRGGYHFMQPPIDYVKPAGAGPTPAGRYREAIFFDPDGVPVSLIQYEPSSGA